MFTVGGRVGFSRGDVKLLMDDIKDLRPTVLPVVPRILNRIYDKVTQEARKHFIKAFLLDRAVKSKTKDLNNLIVRNTTLWDKMVFRRVREGMGGRVRLMITGSAPLSPETLTFMRAAMGCIVLEGYGQTECVAACAVTLEGDHKPGHVGPPIPCCQIKLADVLDMNYFAREGAGEVCIKGHNVFKGYYKDQEKTAEALDEDGWLHTGDIGRWTPEGTIKLVDRKKNIFKLAQGEYIAPEKIENVYLKSRFVAQIYVHGESLKSCLVAVVSPDISCLTQYAEKDLGLKLTLAELCKNDKIKQAIIEDLNAEGKKAGLHSFEQVRDIYLHPETFSVEAGLLTPTLKTKRPAMRDYFKEQISQMYRALD
jgi:long-chain acyl-CoA synthetase